MPGEPLPGGSAGELFAPGACTEAADAADKLGASAPLPDAQPVTKEPSAREVAASDQMNEAAEKHGVMWARVKGFPHWPVRACFSPLFTLSCFAATGVLPPSHRRACQVLALQSSPLSDHFLHETLYLWSRTVLVQHFPLALFVP